MKSELVKWKERLVATRDAMVDMKKCYQHAVRKVEIEERKLGVGKAVRVGLIIMLVFVLGYISGCATMSGLGRDITAVSDGLAQSAVGTK
jgi:predicted small secreted protein